MKKLFVKDLRSLPEGTAIEEDFAIHGVQARPKKNGELFLEFVLADRTGEITAKLWDYTPERHECLKKIRFGRVRGTLEDFQGCQVRVQAAVRDLGLPADTADFEEAAPLPVSELSARLDAHVASVRDRHLWALLQNIFQDEVVRPRFADAPAAKSNHHAWRHGLLQHTIEVTDIAAAVADVQRTWGYRPLQRDLIVTAALLHDVGKIRELCWEDGERGYTLRGELLGHIPLGIQLVTARAGRVEGFPSLLRDLLLHAIHAHHGCGDFGSPVPPMLAEAQIVHMADLLDTQMFYMHEAAEGGTEEFVWLKKLENRRVYTQPVQTTPRPLEVVPTIMTAGARPPLPVLRFASAGGRTRQTSFETRRLPLVGRVAAGSPLSAIDDPEEHLDVEAAGLATGAFLLRIRGDSMTGDGIEDGDIVVVRPQEHHEPEDIVVALLKDQDEAAIKRVERIGDRVYLVSSNPRHAPILVSEPDTLLVRGRVLARLGPAEASDDKPA